MIRVDPVSVEHGRATVCAGVLLLGLCEAVRRLVEMARASKRLMAWRNQSHRGTISW